MSSEYDGDHDRLPEIGYIQSCGSMLAFEEDAECPSGMRILCASENIVDVPWIHTTSALASELLGKDLGHLFCAEYVDTVRSLVKCSKQVRKPRADHMVPRANRNTADILPLPPTGAAPQAEAAENREAVTFTLVESNPGVYLVELEPRRGPHHAGAKRAPELREVMDLLECMPVGANPKTLTAALCEALAESMPAYDRFMVYRFAPDGSGEVIHEGIRPGSDAKGSLLNLRFPARDIPPIGRELLKLKGVSFIADTSAPPVPICFLLERIAILDLSKSSLRVSSECHLQFIRKRVKASLVIALVVDGELWGCLNFHSYEAAVHPSCEERMLVSTAAAIVQPLIYQSERENIATTALSLSRVLGKLNSDIRVNEFLSEEYMAMLEILDVDSIILREHAQSVTVYGNKEIFLTQRECTDLRNGDHSGDTVVFQLLRATGVAFFSVDSTFMAFLRGSVASHVQWAGNPDEPQLGGSRASFEAFTTTAAATFKAWEKPTVDLLGMVRHGISSKLYADDLSFRQQETFAHVSHELRTPFHGVMGSLEMLEAEHGRMDAAEQENVIRSALRCGHSMMATLDDILEVAKVRNNRRDVAHDRFSPSGPILMTVAVMSPFAATESVDLAVDTGSADKDVLEVLGDARRIRGVVQNLVNNAIKFTPTEGKVRVYLVALDSLQEVADWWVEEAGRFEAKVWMRSPTTSNFGVGRAPLRTKWYVYCVEDSGVGVLPSDLPHLVSAYTQVSGGASKSYAGTGLGLHICKAHVNIMLGALGIASTFSEEDKGGGTLFAVALPLQPAAQGATAEVGVEEEKAGEKAGEEAIPRCREIGPRKIAFLVVDDNKVNIKLLEHKIQQFFKPSASEVQVLAATDGFTALEVHAALQGTEHDGPVLAGIFMDFHLPNLDGTECTRRIRALEADNGWPRVTICGCTADLAVKVRKTFKDAGGDATVSKPWHRGDVERMCNVMVGTVLGGEPSGEGDP